MPNFGPTGAEYHIDSIDNSTSPPTIGSATELPRIVECNGINRDGKVYTSTALRDVFENESPLGRSSIARIVLKWFGDVDTSTGRLKSTDGYNVLGPVTTDTDTPTRTFKVTYKTGISRSIEVSAVTKNDPMVQMEQGTQLEAELSIGARVAADFSETL